MINRKKENDKQDNAFYQKNFKTALMTLIILIGIMLALVVVLLYQIRHRPIPPYYAVAQDGRRMTLSASNDPNLLSNAILRWATKAAITAYTFDFTQSDNELAQTISPYFTEEGWKAYWRSVQKLLETVRQNKIFAYAVVSNPPVISNQGELPGKGEVKRVQLPFLVTYESAEKKSTESRMVTLTLVRVPTTQNPNAMAIDQFIMG